MSTIEKRTTDAGTSYRVKVRLTGYPPETATFERLTDARAWAAKTESDMKAGRHFGQSKRHNFAELADEYAPHAKDAPRLDYWRETFGPERLDTITPARIAKERDKLLSEETDRKDAATGELKKRTGATVNRYLAALSSCLSYGVKELQWLERNPMERVRKPAEGKGRVRFLSDDERAALLIACRPHADLYLAVVLSLTTGARQAEIMGLRWGQVDFARQVISLTETKNGDRRALPLVGEAFTLLRERGRVRTLHDDRIFPPTARARKADCLDLRDPWTKALKTAGIENFHWHDLRHTAASYLVMSGVSLLAVAKVLGHRTLQMVARYSHLSDEHLVATGQRLADRLGVGQ
ncbi:MAG: site-specific integrase [Hydrogenophilales bacterium CG17_big_fil_post_rev_8_21_14_2_50_63_12]|nr:MAG: site-specific integrase [Hydrogenophilales bacterium CG17_big_fil_post_rev_8_21_14_2_50_63_12]PIX98174.1 MAG: site-specific integrase [Hydrogenophilales bacterium CG_4_10_14_3_um_filter_63_21]PJB03037.1 MAG: site-specific integrase [Hydrogenophilales bacterium CG_4_9_14_3_um_filter_63_34]